MPDADDHWHLCVSGLVVLGWHDAEFAAASPMAATCVVPVVPAEHGADPDSLQINP
jgi:hypothetical protein